MKGTYENILRPILFAFDPEFTHTLSLWSLKLVHDLKIPRFFASRMLLRSHPVLVSTYHGITFPNPVGVAAGYDKNGLLVPAIQLLGVGFFEIGSITALPSRGNPRPRLVRITRSDALINRMGLNNAGVDQVVRRISRNKHQLPIPLVVSIAKTNDPRIKGKKAIQDYCYSFRKIHPIADLITLNISCPNTMDGKTFESPQHLESLLTAILTVKDEIRSHGNLQEEPPVLIKVGANVSPRLLGELIEISLDHGIQGFILTNTHPLSSRITMKVGLPSGGLSGKPLFHRSLKLVRHAAEIIGDDALLIGVGGIFSSIDALKMFQSGAHLIQVFTGLVYKGPTLPKKINNTIIKVCQKEQLKSFQEFCDFIRQTRSLEERNVSRFC